ncbi:MAG: zinc ABC transporter substrate-binding protein, partial [Planctomycetota bacterium]
DCSKINLKMKSITHTNKTLALLLVLTVIGCDSARPTGKKNGTLTLIATTGQVNAALQKLTDGTETEIELFCGPGVDPHSFAASTKDMQAMLNADAIFYNGFHLEAKLSEQLHETFADKAWAMSSAFPEQDRLDWVEDGQIDPNAPFDPHIWNHLPAWSKCVEGLATRLSEIDPDNADTYSKNAAAYIAEIEETHRWAEEQLASLPEDRRVIVSAHDAFKYLEKVYGVKTTAVLGIGNDPEADIQTMQKVAKQICDEKIPAIFLESITNPKVTTALQEACEDENWSVKIVDTPLYSDDLGDVAPQNTFLGAFRSNIEIICESLKQ